MSEVRRYAGADDLAVGAAERLLGALVRLQEGGRTAHLCLTGGGIANRIYAELGGLLEGSSLDPGRLELWWGDERFVPTGDPDRNAGQTLAVLAERIPLDPARTHPMPSADGLTDNATSASTYAEELGDTVFDICLLGLGEDGHVASIFPGHPSFDPADAHTVVAVDDSPQAPPARISLTIPAINRSAEVWFLVSGETKAAALAAAVAGDERLPAGVARGMNRTVWLVDAAAAQRRPYYECTF